MAEWRHGAARGNDDVIYITVSTGIGGGIVIDGRPLIGKDGTAGEVGHVTVEIDGPLCGDGSPGHAEAIGSGTAIAREGRALLETGRSPQLADDLRRPPVPRSSARSTWPRPPTRGTPPARPCWTAPGSPLARCAPAWSTC